ncbi:hypothetical protein LTR37_021347 [Vermiconidia calcicola]|uniref:Uncharacterized protein n=1 Tax=Vermiconidia calcicola TaxID=1690605 RepID=A0ACC3M8U1_9PEZI|nr:hypothetical protein LTR37_021347 [Vermiconidia calcicola]
MASSIQPGGFGTPTQEDRRPWLWITIIVSSVFSVLTLSARVSSKWEYLGVEDIIIGVAYAFGLVNWGLYVQVTLEGVGATNVVQDSESASELFFTSQVIMLCAIYFSKLSVLWFARRIFCAGSHKKQRQKVFDVAVGFTAIFGVASIVLLSARCNFRLALNSASRDCKSLQARWIVIQVLNATTELGIVVLPTHYISRNTIRRSKKITVITLFGFRLPCIALMAATAVSYKPITSGIGTHFIGATTAAVWSQVLLGYSLSSASFPCVKSFLTAFVADSVYRVYDTTEGSYGTVGGSRIAGDDRMKVTQSSRMVGSSIAAKPKAHPDKAESVASDGSLRMMIERSVEIEIVDEEASQGGYKKESRQQFPYQGAQPYTH